MQESCHDATSGESAPDTPLPFGGTTPRQVSGGWSLKCVPRGQRVLDG